MWIGDMIEHDLLLFLRFFLNNIDRVTLDPVVVKWNRGECDEVDRLTLFLLSLFKLSSSIALLYAVSANLMLTDQLPFKLFSSSKSISSLLLHSLWKAQFCNSCPLLVHSYTIFLNCIKCNLSNCIYTFLQTCCYKHYFKSN